MTLYPTLFGQREAPTTAMDEGSSAYLRFSTT